VTLVQLRAGNDLYSRVRVEAQLANRSPKGRHFWHIDLFSNSTSKMVRLLRFGLSPSLSSPWFLEDISTSETLQLSGSRYHALPVFRQRNASG
jgi:hypothetical protein